MIHLDSISKSYGGRVLFQDLSWRIDAGRRIGLIGPNGAGKTTLFSIIAGEIEPDTGRAIRARGTTVGVLPQQVDEIGEGTIEEIALEGRADLLAIESRLAELRGEIDETGDDERLRELTHQLAENQERYQIGGGYELRSRVRSILAGMGFDEVDFDRPAAELSGGWRVRLLLARLLVRSPSFLLMDEPTNHLDLPSLEWLEGFLGGYDGTVVVISHDRYFLNRLVTEIAALEPDGFYVRPGNYDAYEAWRAEHLEQLRSQREQQERKIKETERFIERFRYKATKAKQVQSRVKQLEKMELVELPDQRKTVQFTFPDADRTGREVLIVEGVAKRYGDVEVYDDLDLLIERGDRAALVGPNGEGKSTLLKLLAGAERPDEGAVRRGHNVAVGYFAQHQVDALELGNTVLEELESAAELDMIPRCRSILGAFLFSGDDVEKKVAVLSGGERSRLALAKLLVRPSNVLLLDEPTNHLDMASRGVLVDALREYAGTLIFVSHDRAFINALAKRVLHVEGGGYVDYPGDYDYYRYKRTAEREEEEGVGSSSAREAVPSAGSTASSRAAQGAGDDDGTSETRDEKRARKHREAQLRNEIGRRTRKLRDRLSETESTIAELEDRKGALETEMADPALYEDKERTKELAQAFGELESELAARYDAWAEIASRIEAIEEEIREEVEGR